MAPLVRGVADALEVDWSVDLQFISYIFVVHGLEHLSGVDVSADLFSGLVLVPELRLGSF